MFLKKYLNEFYYNLVEETYDYNYLCSLNEENFFQIYKLLRKYNFYFIDDIILNYIEIFSMDVVDVEKKILKLKDRLGENFVYIIGNDMRYLNEIIKEDN